MGRVLMLVEGLGYGGEEYVFTARDMWCNPVELVILPSIGKNNPIAPTDDDRAIAIASLIEYLYGDYDAGIVIALDRRVEILIEHYIKRLRERRDFCYLIPSEEVRSKCYEVLNSPEEHRAGKLLRFNVVRTSAFRASEKEVIDLIRGSLYFMAGVKLTRKEVGLLIGYIRNGWRGEAEPGQMGGELSLRSTGCTPPQQFFTDFNLVVSVERNSEYKSARELRRIGNILKIGIKDVLPTGFDGIITAHVSGDPVKFVWSLKKLVNSGEYAPQYVFKVVPVIMNVKTDINDIVDATVKLASKYLGSGETYKVEIRKRGIEFGKMDIIRAIAREIAKMGNKVKLEHPHKIIQVEVFPTITGISIIEEYDVFKNKK